MKNWNYTRFLPLLLALLAVGCSKTELDSEEIRTGETAIIEARITTYNTADGISLGAAEKVINRVRVYAFDGDRLDRMVYREYTAAEDVEVTMDVRKTPAKTLYVIVNEPKVPAIQSALALIDNPAAFGTLEYQMAQYFTSMAGSVFNSAAAFASGDFCLPMFGKTDTPVNTTAAGADPITVAMPIRRSLARVDIYMQKAVGVSQQVGVDQTSAVDIANTRTKGYFAPMTIASGDLSEVEGTQGPQTALIIPERNSADNAKAVRAYTFYTPERSCATEPERLAFTLKGIDFGGRRMDYAPLIIGNAAGEELTQIERNKVYRVYCTLKQVSVDVVTTIAEWDDVDVNGDILAGTMLSVDRSRVLVDYDADKRTYSSDVSYLSDGHVSFVGYVTKDAEDKDVVTTDGSNLPSWLPVGNITGLPDGKTLSGSIRVICVPTAAEHPNVVLRLKTGNIVKDITLVYDNGFIPSSELQKMGWTASILPGVGLQIAKMGNVLPSAVADTDWDREYMIFINSTNPIGGTYEGFGYGPANTEQLISKLGNITILKSCRSLGAEWYIPSLDELKTISKNIKLLGVSYSFMKTEATSDVFNGYWSSSEATLGSWMTGVSMYGSILGHLRKSDPFYVRCVRNIEPLVLSKTQLTADYVAWGNSFLTSVAFESADGAVSVKSIDNADPAKNWLKSAVLSGSTEGEVVITYAPTNNQVHSNVKITLVTAGGYEKVIEVIYDNGLIPESFLSQNWKVNRPVLGIQVAKRGNRYPTDVADADWSNELMPWGRGPVQVAPNTAYGAGHSNTEIMWQQSSRAGSTCFDMQNNKWYLPSRDELIDIVNLQNFLGNSYRYNVAKSYWSSTDARAGESIIDGTIAYIGSVGDSRPNICAPKTENNAVRCVYSANKGNEEFLFFDREVVVCDYAATAVVNKKGSFVEKVQFQSPGGSISLSVDNSGPSKDWLVSATTGFGTLTSGELVIKYKPTPGNGGVHDDVTITVTNSFGSKTITVKYDNGLIPWEAMVDVGWPFTRYVDQDLLMGALVSKKGNVLPSMDAAATELLMPWATVTTSVPEARNQLAGRSNTTAIINALGKVPGSSAALSCRSLSGLWYSWHMPAKNELEWLQKCSDYLGKSYKFNGGTYYWSSTEVDIDAVPLAYRTNQGSSSGGTKSDAATAVRAYLIYYAADTVDVN